MENNLVSFNHEKIMEYLLEVFEREKDDLLLQVASDGRKKREFVFILNYNMVQRGVPQIFRGQVTYNKKERRFTHIEYRDKNGWPVQFSINTKIAYSYYQYWQPLLKMRRFWTIKKLKEYLLTH